MWPKNHLPQVQNFFDECEFFFFQYWGISFKRLHHRRSNLHYFRVNGDPAGEDLTRQCSVICADRLQDRQTIIAVDIPQFLC